jgi:hypothetical protein
MTEPIVILKRKPLDDNAEQDDWSDKGQSARDDGNDTKRVAKPVKHPFEVAVDRISRERGIPKYLAATHARKENPGSFKHYQQQGAVSSRPRISKAAPHDDVALAWNAAVDAYVAGHGCSRTEGMSALRKIAPRLWTQRFRR